MGIDTATKAFLALSDSEVAGYAAARAEAIGLALPAETLGPVVENLTLLRGQTALFVAALSEMAGEAPEPFQP